VEEFFETYFAPDGSLCVVAGDMEPEALRRFTGEQLSLWKKRRKARGAVAPPLQHPEKTVLRLVDKPDLTQTSLAVGHAAPGEKCGEKNALLLANHILGGGNFSSRLMNRIRSADGKTYNVVSQLLSETEFGTLMITTSTQNSQLAGVLRIIIDEYRRFCAEGVTAGELEKAKQFAIGNMAFQLEGIGNIVDKLLWLRFYGRPNSYIERFDEQITRLDVGAVNEAVRRHLSPENLVIIAVGKKDEILEPLRTFGPVKTFHFRDQP
jgi:zinc protease